MALFSNRPKVSVAVLRGGPSNEYDVSLQSGANVISHLLEHLPEKYEVHDILIDKAGVWYRGGVPKTPAKALHGIDVVFNGLIGEYGEDGKVQQILNSLNARHTGSQALAAALGMNKSLSKKVFADAGLLTADYILIESDGNIIADAREVFHTMPLPLVVKPNFGGSSNGVTIARNYDQLIAGLAEALKYSSQIIVEKYIDGREATCGVIEKFRDQDIYSLFPIEIIPPVKSGFFSRDVKYTGATKEICPGNFDHETTKMLQDMATAAHIALGMRHYSRSDFIISPKGIYLLETNSLPGLTTESLLPKSLEAVGATFPQFLDHILNVALVG